MVPGGKSDHPLESQAHPGKHDGLLPSSLAPNQPVRLHKV
jgi:hypothetical protein